MTDNKIMTTLRKCADHACYCCTEYGKEHCRETIAALAWDLMFRQKEEIEQLKHKYDLAVAEREANVKGFTEQIEEANAEINRLEYTLLGVMHSVDKWLDGDELKQNEVDRAATMREKTLQIVERLKNLVEASDKNCKTATGIIDKWEKRYAFAKAEAVKEFAERLKKEAENVGIDREGDFIFSDSGTFEFYSTVAEWCKEVTDILVKELTEERAQ